MVIMGMLLRTFETREREPIIGGNVRNRFSRNAVQKLLIPSLINEKKFLFGRSKS